MNQNFFNSKPHPTLSRLRERGCANSRLVENWNYHVFNNHSLFLVYSMWANIALAIDSAKSIAPL